MGVIFDASPTLPLYRASDPRNMVGGESKGAEISGVVSGILDDGKKNWLDDVGAVREKGLEAKYVKLSR